MTEFLDRGRSGQQRLDLPHPPADRRQGRRRACGRGAAPQPDLGLARGAPARRGRGGGGRRAARVAGGRRCAGVGAAVRDRGGRTGPGRCPMISLRYHAVSIAAVFLALAVGVVLGSSGVSDRVLAAVSTQRDDLGAQVTRLTAERDALAAQERAADEFAVPGGAGRRARAAGGTDGRAGRRRRRHRGPRRRRRPDRPGRRDRHGPGRADRRRRRPGTRGPVARADLPAAADGRAAAGGVGHRQPGGRPARRGPAGPRRTGSR